ncbi:polymorphic toxin-type HINT domain-containing protein, partial [Actinoplanes xinjiangensis]|uniref:polymorphic toxin-type HINT domain-containing protein n=1 Tax=Actinoplanes xinjiangensis TaxID=512350 RepID=UPI00342AECF0
AGGPEVKAAAQVALSGPKSYLTYFLTTSQFQAAQRDQEQAAHVQAARALVIQTQEYAQKAMADAAKANAAALKAWDKVAEANKAAADAIAYANKAAGYANDAKKSAAEAKASADQAAQSATKAKQAAASAQASADAAAQSAATATAAAARARADADAAYAAKRDARASANAAGKDAAAADTAAKEAAAVYTLKLKEYEAQQRNTAPGSGSDGVGSAADDHKTWGCLQLDPSAVSTECLKVYKDFAGALADQPKCATPANQNSPGCLMLGDLKSFIGENDEVLLDVLQFVLMGCGLVPVVGEACDGIDAAVSFSRGDWAGGLLSLGSAIPGLGYATTGVKAWKNSDKLRNVKQLIDNIVTKCRTSSFAPGTRVLLADGRSEEIENLQVGDSVLATDPTLGRTGARMVTATLANYGSKDIVELTVEAEGTAKSISATKSHPFWVPALKSWVPAEELVAGTELRDDKGALVRVEQVEHRTELTWVHNLTVDEFHTYYVLVGDTPVLVHNCTLPRGFAGKDDYNKFIGDLDAGLASAGHPGTKAAFQGSSVTGVSFKTGREFGSHSDYDVALGGKEIFEKAKTLGIKLREGKTRTGPLKGWQLDALGLTQMRKELSAKAGRPVNFMVFQDIEKAMGRSPSLPAVSCGCK